MTRVVPDVEAVGPNDFDTLLALAGGNHRDQVNRLLPGRLESYVKDDQRGRKAARELLRLSRVTRSGSGGRPVRREDLYGD
jgi:hypothetical protein